MPPDTATRVLIVDDDDGVRRSLSRVVRSKGFHVTTAPDGESGVRMAGEFMPHLVILDIRMPDIDGFEVLSRIRDQSPQMPVIFMTAYTASSQAREAIPVGAMLSKPLCIDTLITHIHQLTGASS